MNYITKSNKDDDFYVKKKGFRNLITKKISQQFKKDSFLDNNPFSQQLSPWNGTSKLETSTNLLRQQAESRILSKLKAADSIQPSVQHIVSHDSIDYTGLSLHYSRQQQKQFSSRYTYPRLKINSQQVIVSKGKKDEAKRLLFHKKSTLENKNKKTKKIANLTIEWDDDIIYNPQKKYFEEQSLKRKILRQFSHTRNENRHQSSRKDLKCQDKTFKLEFKNNRIHRKQVTIFQFKKHQNSLSPVKEYSKNQQFSSQGKKEQRQNQSQVRVSNLSFQPIHSRADSPQLQVQQNNPERAKSYNSDKWKFRSSIRAKRNISPEKGGSKNMSKNQVNDKTKQISQNGQSQALNRITLQLNERIKDHCAPIQIMTKTSPLFFKKTVE